MNSTKTSFEDSRKRLDEMVPLFDGSTRPVRGFGLESDWPGVAMFDSETGDDGVPYLWIGHWGKNPASAFAQTSRSSLHATISRSLHVGGSCQETWWIRLPASAGPMER